MKRFFCFLVFVFLFISGGNAMSSNPYRCGSYLVQTGDKAFEVLRKCGDPIAKEHVGYTVRENRRELEIKEWIYGPENGVYHYLIFHGTSLVEIESRRDPK